MKKKRELISKLEQVTSGSKKRYIQLAILSIIVICCYFIYCFTDVIDTTRHGMTIWYLLRDGHNLGEFYVTPLQASKPYYDFIMYIVFAIWGIPLYLYEMISGNLFQDSYICMLYAKSILIPFLCISIKKIYEISFEINNDEKMSCLSVFLFLFSALSMQNMVVMGGYDIISVCFSLCGIQAYLKRNNKKFYFYFACAIGFKMFAILIFIPLILLRWKNVFQILARVIVGSLLLVVPKMYFVLYGLIHNMQTIIESNADIMIDYLWGDAPLTLEPIPLILILYFALWIACWFANIEPSAEHIILISFLSIFILLLCSMTHPQWGILIAPYLSILCCVRKEGIKNKVYCSLIFELSYLMWEIRRCFASFSFVNINTFLKFEENTVDLLFVNVGILINKLGEYFTGDVENIWRVIRAVVVASALVLLYLINPYAKKRKQQKMEIDLNVFIIKASVSLIILLFPIVTLVERLVLHW